MIQERQANNNESANEQSGLLTDETENTERKEIVVESSTSVKEAWRGSPNVRYTMLYNFIDGAAFSVWQAQVAQMLIYVISGNSNVAVGFVSGVAGVAQVVAAVVCGLLSDNHGREKLLQSACSAGMVAVVVTLIAVRFEEVSLFYASSVLWGMYVGFGNPASEALFADSVAKGNRTGVYTVKWTLQILCYCVGYIINMVLFFCIGNHWGVSTMQTVLYCGLGLHPLAMVVMLFLRDKEALSTKKGLVRSPLLEKVATPTAAVSGGDNFGSFAIPALLSASDVLTMLGSGMTMRFIPLFFINDYGVAPALMMGVLIAAAIITAAFALLSKYVAEKWAGRMVVMASVRGIGAFGLVYLALASGWWGQLAPMLLVHIVRYGFMNSSQGMSRSVIMDYASPSARAKWSALESLSNFSWAGSAALGGIIADRHGYRATFLITVAFHSVGVGFLVAAALTSRCARRRVVLASSSASQTKYS